MLRKLFTATLLAAATICCAAGTARMEAPDVSSHHRGVRLTPEQMRVVQAVSPQRHRTSTLPVSGMGKHKRISSTASMLKAPAKVNPSGSRIQGWRISDEIGSMPSGWYELNLDGSENLLWEYHDPNWVDDGWSDEPLFPFNSGFYKDDKVIGFHSEMLLNWLIWGYGCFSLDGEILDYHQYGDDLSITDFSTYVISCVYDENNDKTYAYTLNADASGYMLQTIDLATWSFTPVSDNVLIEDICVGFAYNPDDKTIYGYTPDSRFVTFNGESSELTTVTRLDFPVTALICGMTYSPIDKAFVFVFCDGNNDASLYMLQTDGSITYLADLSDAEQYSILITPDKIADPMTPLTPELLSVDFPNGSLDGSISVKMPVSTFGGQDISEEMSLLTYIDNILYGEMTTTPGQTIEMAISDVEEGMRNFSISARTGELESARIEQKAYVGYDIPFAPTDISLAEGTLSWSAVSDGENGGFIDVDALTYNVYLNGEKINDAPVSDCSYTFQMPDEVYRKYVAQVEADNHGHLSQRGFSNDIKAGKPFPLPFSMTPTLAEGELIAVFTDRGEAFKWRVVGGEGNSYLFCNAMAYNGESSEWFILPAINIGQPDKLLEISFEVQTYKGSSDNIGENISFAYGFERQPEAMAIAKTWDGIDSTDEWKSFTVWCLPQEEEVFFGFRTNAHDGGGIILVRNINISVSDKSSMTPAEVTELTATALPEGQLKAKVDFRMPEVSAAGLPLGEQTLTATVSSTVGTASVSGAPGSLQSVEVATAQGLNDITVTAANENIGLDNSVGIFTGLDVPVPIDAIRISHSEDYKSLHLEWDAPADGFNGGYVDPASVEYALYMYNEETYEWEFAEAIGTSTQYDFIPASVESLSVSGGAILASNTQGDCGVVFSFGAPVGAPYNLPLMEDFNNTVTYQPIYNPNVTERPDDSYTCEWDFVNEAYPMVTSQMSPYGAAAFCAFGEEGAKARVALPVFSTAGIESAAVELPIWCGPDAATINVYAEAYGMEPELIGSFSDPSEAAWRKHRFHLPQKFLGKQWVSIKIDAVFNEGNTVGAFADYRIKTFLKEDVGVMDISAPVFASIGDELAVTTLVENTGIETVSLPSMRLEVYKESSLIESIDMTPAEDQASLAELEQMRYQAVWSPDGDGCGDITFKTVYADKDMDDSNNFRSAVCGVTTGNQPVVDDLEAVTGDYDVTLTWSEPLIETGKEGFENFLPFYFSDRIGDFQNINRDGFSLTYFNDFRFPYDDMPKGWQILGENELTELMESVGKSNDYVHACSGNNLIAAFAPISFLVGEELQADKWLVSPLVKGGSELRFMLSVGWDGYRENVELMYSTTDDNPESFECLDKILLLSAQWKEYSYTLPEDARYFAIVYRSVTGGSFFVMLDDIEYEPVESAYTIEGYDILRDGLTVTENAAARGSWTDAYVVPETGAVYNVVPVVSRNGSVSRGFKSNDAHATRSGVADILDGAVKVAAGKGFVTVSGCEDADITVTTADGINVAILRGVTGTETIRLAAGVYVGRVSGRSCRVMVR